MINTASQKIRKLYKTKNISLLEANSACLLLRNKLVQFCPSVNLSHSQDHNSYSDPGHQPHWKQTLTTLKYAFLIL